MSNLPETSNADISKGYICSHCGSYVKEYTRSFNCNMALALIALYKNQKNEFVKVEDYLLRNGYQRCGDFSYLRFYRYLEPLKERRSDGSKRNGYYRLTAVGRLFVEGKVLAFEKFKILHNTFTGFEGKEIDIRQALGIKFNYDNLMGIIPSGAKTDKEVKQLKKEMQPELFSSINNNNITDNNY